MKTVSQLAADLAAKVAGMNALEVDLNEAARTRGVHVGSGHAPGEVILTADAQTPVGDLGRMAARLLENGYAQTRHVGSCLVYLQRKEG